MSTYTVGYFVGSLSTSSINRGLANARDRTKSLVFDEPVAVGRDEEEPMHSISMVRRNLRVQSWDWRSWVAILALR